MLRVALVAALVLAVPASATLGDFVIQGDRSFAGVRTGAKLEAAVKKLGPPSSVLPRGDSECVATWKRIGAVVTLLHLSGGKPCPDGVIVGLTATGKRWRTARGVRVGDGVQRIHDVFPQARHVTTGLAEQRGWWLVTRRYCELGGRRPYPGLLARMRGDTVAALVVTVGVCE